jgi:hypothetical protein
MAKPYYLEPKPLREALAEKASRMEDACCESPRKIGGVEEAYSRLCRVADALESKVSATDARLVPVQVKVPEQGCPKDCATTAHRCDLAESLNNQVDRIEAQIMRLEGILSRIDL